MSATKVYTIKGLDGNTVEVKRSEIRKLFEIKADYSDEPDVIEVILTKNASKMGVSLEALQGAITQYESEIPKGKRENSQEVMGLLRLAHHDMTKHQNTLIDLDDETIDKLDKSTLVNFVKSFSHSVKTVSDIARNHASSGAVLMTVIHRFPYSEKGLIDTSREVNPQGMMTVFQSGWDDGAKIKRFQNADRPATIVGSQIPVYVFKGGEDQPLTLTNNYASGQPPRQSKKSGYAVLWDIESLPIDSFSPEPKQPKVIKSKKSKK